MDDQSAILDATTCTQVCPVPHQDHVHRLLPWRFRREIDRPLVATIHEDKQPVGQTRMKDIIFTADPEEVVQRSVFQAGQWLGGFSQEERNFLTLFKHLFKESTPTRHVVVVRVFVGLRGYNSASQMIGNRFRAGFSQGNSNRVQKRVKLQAVKRTESNRLVKVTRGRVEKFV